MKARAICQFFGPCYDSASKSYHICDDFRINCDDLRISFDPGGAWEGMGGHGRAREAGGDGRAWGERTLLPKIGYSATQSSLKRSHGLKPPWSFSFGKALCSLSAASCAATRCAGCPPFPACWIASSQLCTSARTERTGFSGLAAVVLSKTSTLRPGGAGALSFNQDPVQDGWLQ